MTSLLSPIKSLFYKSSSPPSPHHDSQSKNKDDRTLPLLSFPSFSTGLPRQQDVSSGTSVLLQKEYYHKRKSKRVASEPVKRISVASTSSASLNSTEPSPAVAALSKCHQPHHPSSSPSHSPVPSISSASAITTPTSRSPQKTTTATVSKKSSYTSPLWKSRQNDDDVCPVKQVMLPEPAVMATD